MRQVRLEALKLAKGLEGVDHNNLLTVSELIADYIATGPKVVELEKTPRKSFNK